jgi:hypothetical protein
MRKHQRGVTMLGWLFLLAPLAIVFYACVRLTPIYLNYMNVTHALTQVATEMPNNIAAADGIRTAIEKHLNVAGVTFPDVKDLKITRIDGIWTMEANYDDQTPLFANIFISVTFDKIVTLKPGE